jgi:hypothetical protein
MTQTIVGGFGNNKPEGLPEGYENMTTEVFAVEYAKKNSIILAPEWQRDDLTHYKKRMVLLHTGLTDNDYYMAIGARRSNI